MNVADLLTAAALTGVLLLAVRLGQLWARWGRGPVPDTVPADWAAPTVPLDCTGPCTRRRTPHELTGDGTATCLRCGTPTHLTTSTED